MARIDNKEQVFWDLHAKRDPLWAILSDPSKRGRLWDLRSFMETGRREVSLLMYQLQALNIPVRHDAALDFGCGVGRLSQPLARYFERVVGVDISSEMVRLANQINQHPGRVRYVCNAREDLFVLATGAFTFMYSSVVLQHMEPASALGYLRELFRVVAPGGVLVFQLPSHPRPLEEQRQPSSPMADEAYRASVRVESEVPQLAAPGAEVVLAASVTNAASSAWSQRASGLLRLGNHWLAADGHTMLVQDDGRAELPETVAPGETCLVALKVTLPPQPGDYELECDVVHEGISWFADKGSSPWRGGVRVAGPARMEPLGDVRDSTVSAIALSLADDSSSEEPAPPPMHGVPRAEVETLVRQHGATLAHVELDERCGQEWVGYRYFVRKA